MAKTRDIPYELRNFNKIFESICYRHEHSGVFEDYLDFFINYFSFNHKIDLEYLKRKYKLEERHKFHELIMESIKVMDKMIVNEKDWYDIFGDYYQVLSSKSKSSALGQFFTPESLCNFMAQILDVQDGETVNEPTCGSGRFNLAVHVNNPKIFHVAQDLDYMCVRMTALNFMMHGITGVVICMNTLSMDPKSFRGAFRVNQYLKYTGVPQIEYIDDVNYAWNFITTKTKATNKSKVIEIMVNEKTNQIAMF